MSEPQINFLKRFLNIFTLMHFNYFEEATKELNELINAPDAYKDSAYAKPIANLLLNWVKDTQEDKNRV